MRLATTVLTLCFFFLPLTSQAQLQMRGWELGGWLGSSFYLGDLNTQFRLNHPNIAGGLMARYNFNHRIAVRGGLSHGRIEAYDSDSENSFERIRNLSFQTRLTELSGQLEFNFLPYYHGSRQYFFTPYAFVGFAGFHYVPRTVTDGGTSIKLRQLGTEGQTQGNRYSPFGLALSYGIGIRWDLSYAWSMDVHLDLRNTTTDYLDDVSTVYPDPDQLRATNGEAAFFLSDRSLAPEDGGPRLARAGTQRGDDTVNDKYFFLGIGLNYYFGDVICPTVNKDKKVRRRQKRAAKKRSQEASRRKRERG
ncbi:hypothetical protein LEM8419_00412 [Neolewinella maritima]|uniref:DUF6089 domain-containing protein n=1 Tax=Neolewinella maritima TaxID=1383882 RepID=A0ABM9AXF1_9BACT|nr:DUF6089 family protein [Neolewinella maritima]CAH0999116.1 hypothetical protein LEM8419_00412 [Neolewinella maritima]